MPDAFSVVVVDVLDDRLAARVRAVEPVEECARTEAPVVEEVGEQLRRRPVLAGRAHGETVAVAYVHGSPWSAFTRYEGHGRSRIEINADCDLTVDRALSLACHEAYPGHHTINVLIESAHPDPEFLVMPLFSPLTFKTEGAATFAPDLGFG